MANNQYYQEQFPYNVKPTYKVETPEVRPIIKNKPDPSKEFIIFEKDNLSVIKGWEVKANVNLNNFFVPIENYFVSEVKLHDTLEYQNGYLEIDFTKFPNINGSVSFLMILPYYLDIEDNKQHNWKFQYKINDEEWKNIGRILMLSTGENDIEKICLKNEIGEDISVQILVGC